MTNCNANVTNSIAKPTNSTAKPTNSIANGTNSIAIPTNSIANGTNSIAKVTNSIAKTCIYHCKNLYLPLQSACLLHKFFFPVVHQVVRTHSPCNHIVSSMPHPSVVLGDSLPSLELRLSLTIKIFESA